MSRCEPSRVALAGIVPLLVLTVAGAAAYADTVKVNGLIKARSGPTLILETKDSPKLVVLLNDNTDCGQIQGALKVRWKEMSMAALIPGLAVRVEGTYDDQHRLVATSVKFKGDDLKQAQAIQAGMHETRMQTDQNTGELQKQAEEQQKQGEQLNAEQQKNAANKAAVDAAAARFGQLDDYYILDQVTVYFGNGKVDVEPKYNPQLLQLAEKAKTINGYMIEVKGYASSVGSVAVNQKLSEERAHNVVNILLQQGSIPLTAMLAPGAMGESQSVGDEKTAEGQAENRRVVVRVLQNKAIAGLGQ